MSRAAKAVMHTTLLLVVLAIFASVYVDSLVARAIEHGGRLALGVDTTVSDVDLHFRRGSVDISGLEIANPEGFEGDRFLELGHISAEVAPGSLREPVVVIPRVMLEDVVVSLEGSPGRTNYGTLLGHASSLGSGGATDEQTSDGTRFVIEELVVRNVRADLSLQGLGTKLAGTQVELPELVLRNVGSDSGGVEMAGLIARITREIATAASRQVPQLPSALAAGARSSVDRVKERASEGLRNLLGGDDQ